MDPKMKTKYHLLLIFVFLHPACRSGDIIDKERIPKNKSVVEFHEFDAADYKALMEIKDGGIRR
jgi:hypothetical protein